MRSLAIYVRSLDPQLPRQVWLIQAGGVMNSLGNGIVLPFVVIYLHNVREISFAAAGLALSLGAVAALAAGVSAGAIVDRFGGRNTLLLGLVLQAGCFLLFPLIRQGWHAFVLLAVEGAGTACFWPGQSTLLSRLSPAKRTSSAFALQRISMNLGMGLGGVAGGLIASTRHPESFTVLFVLDAATFLAFAAVLPAIREPAAERFGGDREEVRTTGEVPRVETREAIGYRGVLRDRNFVWLLALNVLFVAVGYEVFALLPPFAKNYVDVSERWVGFIWLANTLLIVLIQLPVSKALEGRRRMRALALMSILFAAAALIVLAGGIWLTATTAALVFIGATLVFGVGETLQGPTQAPARRRPRAGSSTRPLLRPRFHVVERRQHPRPRGRRAAAGVAPARGLASRRRDLCACRARVHRARAPAPGRRPPHARRRIDPRRRAAAEAGACLTASRR